MAEKPRKRMVSIKVDACSRCPFFNGDLGACCHDGNKHNLAWVDDEIDPNCPLPEAE